MSRRKTLAIVGGVLMGLLLLGAGASYAWAQTYVGRIAPNVWIGPIPVGGLTTEEAKTHVQKRVDELLTQGIRIRFDQKDGTLPLSTLGGTDAVDDVDFDMDTAVRNAFVAGHGETALFNTVSLLRSLADRRDIHIPVVLRQENVIASIQTLFPGEETPVIDAGFVFAKQGKKWNVTVTPSAAGRTFQMDPLLRTLSDRLERLSKEEITLMSVSASPTVTETHAQKALNAARAALERAPYSMTFMNEHGTSLAWELTDDTLATMLVPTSDVAHPLSIRADVFSLFLDTMADEVEQTPKNARFTVENNRVIEFIGSLTGVAIDREATQRAFSEALNSERNELALAVVKVDPEIATGEVNNLGVKEILGVGTSNYAGSPGNRIRNIRNGVRLLNGILIPPGETFSLLTALAPFTLGNGYLPEKVIKGDKIVPEIGGGLCQIGTTTFRSAMNSGLLVTERRNHSLVVSYYNDPANGNPGTDATIYEPAPDFKFLNDTGSYVLFQAEMLEDIGELRFTFWGTSDGRKGSYSAPVVNRWIGTGEAKEIETTDLPPGERSCQSAFVGADASFTYTVEKPDGTKVETVYDSHYRPLPKICLVGVDALTEPTPIVEQTDAPISEPAPAPEQPI